MLFTIYEQHIILNNERDAILENTVNASHHLGLRMVMQKRVAKKEMHMIWPLS